MVSVDRLTASQVWALPLLSNKKILASKPMPNTINNANGTNEEEINKIITDLGNNISLETPTNNNNMTKTGKK